MLVNVRSPRFVQFGRYYAVGAVNTIMGFSLYALFVALGANIFVAQLSAHVIGATFNYLTYSKAVFHPSAPARLRFALSYMFNYLLSALALALISRIVASHYLAGLLTILGVSLLNYAILKFLVFAPRSTN